MPKDLKVEVLDTEIDYTFKKFLMDAMDQYKPFGSGIKNIRQAVKIADLIEESEGELEFEDNDYEELKKAVEVAEWRPGVARQLLSYYEALDL